MYAHACPSQFWNCESVSAPNTYQVGIPLIRMILMNALDCSSQSPIPACKHCSPLLATLGAAVSYGTFVFNQSNVALAYAYALSFKLDGSEASMLAAV